MADNASITILRNTQANINAEPIKDGNILFTTDQNINVIYTDVGTKRIKIGGGNTVDDALSETSVNPVQNKVITNSINDVRGQICTNLLNPTAPTQTVNGVTFTNNGDGTYTVNGTASTNTTLFSCNVKAEVGQWLVGCPQGGGEGKYELGLLPDRKWTGWIAQRDSGEGSLIQNVGDSETLDTVVIVIYKGYTANNLLFKPMLTTDLNATYDDFVQYSGDGELNENVAEIYKVSNRVSYETHTNLLNPTAPTQTVNGVTFTNNGDGTYTVNGTCTNNIYLPMEAHFTNLVLSRKYKLVGCPQGGGANTYLIYDDKNPYIETGNGVVYTPTNQPKLLIKITKGTTCNNLLFKPMLTTDLSATYDDFVPYTGDSGRLNEDVANLFDVIRPVGSLYSTTNSSFNPNTAKGWHGTWERIKDCVIYAARDSDTVGSIVGSNTHTLTEAELPSHSHSIPSLSGSADNTQLSYNFVHLSNKNFGYGFLQGGAPLGGNADDYPAVDSTTTRHTHTVTTKASTTGASGSGTAIDMRTRRLNSIVWRRIS